MDNKDIFDPNIKRTNMVCNFYIHTHGMILNVNCALKPWTYLQGLVIFNIGQKNVDIEKAQDKWELNYYQRTLGMLELLNMSNMTLLAT